MDNVKYNMFCDTVLAASLEMIDDELKNCKENASVSIKRTREFNRRFDAKARFRPSPKQIVAIFIAAALLLLAGCGIAYRTEIGNFVVEFYNEYVKISIPKENSKNKDIIPFEANYIPNGYELQRESDPPLVEKKWANADGTSFLIRQSLAGSGRFNLSNRYLETKNLLVDDFTVLYFRYEYHSDFIWSDGTYTFFIDADAGIPEEEVINIIKGISVK